MIKVDVDITRDENKVNIEVEGSEDVLTNELPEVMFRMLEGVAKANVDLADKILSAVIGVYMYSRIEDAFDDTEEVNNDVHGKVKEWCKNAEKFIVGNIKVNQNPKKFLEALLGELTKGESEPSDNDSDETETEDESECEVQEVADNA